MSPLRFNPWLILAFAGGILYPPLAYFGMTIFPPAVLIFVGLALIGMRLLGLRRRPDIEIWKVAFLTAAIGLIGMLFLNPHFAVLAYPIVVSLSVSAVFGFSLFYPPTLVERMARISEPDLPPSGVIYTRRVTMVWTIFLIVNALISAVTAVWGTLAQWTLWNGLVSYLLMGTLFIGEMAVRRMVRR